ncbi:MAG TPA: hypothetical protein PLK30_17695, partial [Blastocatellia bacterium]|nr:hypothetical protein [Blastocatellia bacterium]
KNKSRKTLERIRALGGMVAPILSQGDIRTFDSRIPNDCAGSSKSFAQGYLYAVNVMGGRGVAIGSDANGFAGFPCPRFGPHAASWLNGAHEDTVRGGLRGAQVKAQENGVAYDEPPMMYRTPRWQSAYERQAFIGEQQDLWEAIFLGLSDADIASADLGNVLQRTEWQFRWIKNIATGIRESDANRLPATDIIDTALNFNAGVVSRGAFYAKSFADFSSTPDPDHSNAEIRKVYDKVRPIWVMVQRMNGNNPPYQRHVVGDRDFDINIDGMAHYGLLPDFLRDLKNIGLTDQDLAPLMRSAQDFVEMWGRCWQHASADLIGNIENKANAIAVAPFSDGRLDAYMVGLDGNMWHNSQQPNGAWTGFHMVGVRGNKATDIAAARRPDGGVDVVMVGLDGNMWRNRQQPNGTWTGFNERVGTADNKATKIAIAPFSDGRLDVYMVGLDGNMWHNSQQPNGTWTGFQMVGVPGNKATDIAAVRRPDGGVDVVMVGLDGNMWRNRQQPNGTWTGFNERVGTPDNKAIRIAIAPFADGRLDVYMVGLDGNMWHNSQQPNGVWTGFQMVGRSNDKAMDMAATRRPDGDTDVVVINLNKNIARILARQAK